MRWLGHLDILRTFERAIRRAGLPIVFSNGFNPRERLAFASALSTGITGAAERATLELTASLPVEEVVTGLNAALPPGIRIRICQEIADSDAKQMLHACDRAEYEVVCRCPPETRPDSVEAALGALLAQSEIVLLREREGRSKTVNIRPYLYHLALRPDSVADERLTLMMIVGQGEIGTAKPAEVVGALAQHLPGIAVRRAHRVRLLTAMDPGASQRNY